MNNAADDEDDFVAAAVVVVVVDDNDNDFIDIDDVVDETGDVSSVDVIASGGCVGATAAADF